MKTIIGDIFDGEMDYLIHCANLFHTWEAGFVLPLRKLYLEAYLADKASPKGDSLKLGLYSYAVVKGGKMTVVNLYAQMGIGNDGDPLNRNLQYDFLFDALYRLCAQIQENDTKDKVVIGSPEIGCGLAGGRIRIVSAIFEELESMFPKIEFHLYKLPQ